MIITSIAQFQAAIASLRRQGSYTNSQRPGLTLLDLELGGKPMGYKLLQTFPRQIIRKPLLVWFSKFGKFSEGIRSKL